jgi:prevent-host-death family protein
MRKTVSAVEARRNLGELLEGVSERGDEIAIERAGRILGVVIPESEYAEYRHAKRKLDMDHLFALLEQVRAVSGKYSEEEIQADVEAAARRVRSKA